LSIQFYFRNNAVEQPACAHELVACTRTQVSDENVFYRDDISLEERLCGWSANHFANALFAHGYCESRVTVWLCEENKQKRLQNGTPLCQDCNDALTTIANAERITIGGYC
jgi:hypothetical protein